MRPSDLGLCESCRRIGRRARRDACESFGAEVLEVVRHREKFSTKPLEGLGLEEISALARMFKPPYATYGRLRGYVEETGHLPPEEFERRRQ